MIFGAAAGGMLFMQKRRNYRAALALAGFGVADIHETGVAMNNPMYQGQNVERSNPLYESMASKRSMQQQNESDYEHDIDAAAIGL